MISTYGAFAFDAYYAFLFAINALLHQGLSPSAIRGATGWSFSHPWCNKGLYYDKWGPPVMWTWVFKPQ